MRFAILPLVFALACTQAPPPPEPVPGAIEGGTTVLTVDGRPVTQEMIDAVMKRLPPEATAQLEASPEAREQLEERLIIGELLYQQALEKGLDDAESSKLAIALASREVLAAELIQTVGDEAVTDEAVNAWYNERQVQFRRPSAHVQHILLQDAGQAEKVAEMARGGGDFGKLAGEHSVDRSTAEEGGDLGWVDKGRLLPALDKAVFESEVGQVVGPVQSSVGFHILKVSERRELTPLEAVRDQVEQSVRDEAVDAYISKLRGDANVERTGAEGAAPEGEAAAAAPDVNPPAKAKAKAKADDGHGHEDGAH